MQITTLLGATLGVSAALLSTVEIASAVRLADGTVYFVQPPSLLSATTTFNHVYVWGATYYFTLNLPENAGEPLQQVSITQQEGVDDIEFKLKESSAFEGTRPHKGEKITIKAIRKEDERRTIIINFDPPVSPGKNITIALNPVRNPRFDGVYLFGVTAFPSGEKSHGQFLGFGRLHFYDNRQLFRR